MTANTNTLDRLAEWYLLNCNGDWEHLYGVKIDNVDNPGWLVEINLAETKLQDLVFYKKDILRENQNDWIICSSNGNIYKASCGPRNLNEVLRIFLDWADSVHDSRRYE